MSKVLCCRWIWYIAEGTRKNDRSWNVPKAECCLRSIPVRKIAIASHIMSGQLVKKNSLLLIP
ncbi:hypothetical protein [Okeania sp. SIO1H4]|uniref:hypothetical protein n=1 Tax=Okeania sp. SIO1H4 TaxID=2607776 RepID=UPI00257F82F2|nr:hypothetical protein [Okeania sp. SIO1H4]